MTFKKNNSVFNISSTIIEKIEKEINFIKVYINTGLKKDILIFEEGGNQ